MKIKDMKIEELSYVIASDVNPRDGIGLEVYFNDKMIVEIFRDDTDKTRQVQVFVEELPLHIMEHCIEKFKAEIPWDFIDYSDFE